MQKIETKITSPELETWQVVDRENDYMAEVCIDTSCDYVEFKMPTGAFQILLERAGFERRD